MFIFFLISQDSIRIRSKTKLSEAVTSKSIHPYLLHSLVVTDTTLKATCICSSNSTWKKLVVDSPKSKLHLPVYQCFFNNPELESRNHAICMTAYDYLNPFCNCASMPANPLFIAECIKLVIGLTVTYSVLEYRIFLQACFSINLSIYNSLK